MRLGSHIEFHCKRSVTNFFSNQNFSIFIDPKRVNVVKVENENIVEVEVDLEAAAQVQIAEDIAVKRDMNENVQKESENVKERSVKKNWNDSVYVKSR